MANVIWNDYQMNNDIEGPFLSYVSDGYNKYFADWLLGIIKESSNKNTYDGRYGWIFPYDIKADFQKSQKKKGILKMTKDKQAISGLQAMLESLYQQEKTLYNDLGCKNFEGFKKIWEGNKIRKGNDKKEIQNYWLNKYLSLLVGETQRLITTNRTLIERILALASIEFESIGIEGDIEHYKKDIKNILTEAKFLQIANVVYKEKNKDIDVWVPTREKYSTDDDYTIAITNFFSDIATARAQEIAVEELENDLYYQLSNALGEINKKNTRKNSPRKAKTNTMNRWKVNVNFKNINPANLAKDIYKNVWNYMNNAIVYKLNNEEYKQWSNDKKQYNIQNYVREKIKQLCVAFCQDNPTLSFTGQGLVTNAVQGFFGELYTYGKNYFNLKSYGKQNAIDVDVASIGSLKTNVIGRNSSAQQSGIDTIITVNKKHYGIQVKNPFTTDLGFYKTYKANYTLDKSEYLYNEIFNFNPLEQEEFELINLNLNNTTRPQQLRKVIKDFLYMYTGAFTRLETEKILDTEFKPYMNKNLKHLKGQAINNVFFVLKGELLPSSVILEGIIKQYEYFIESIEKAEKLVSSAANPLQIRYTNAIKKNALPVNSDDKEEKSKAEAAITRYDPDYVHSGNAIQADLQKIKINTALQLELPSIDSIRNRD